MALAGCDSGLFSNQPEIERLEPAPGVFVVDNRGPVRSVSSVRRDRLPGGVVITAVGVPEVQGHWDAELVAITEDGPVNGQLVYEFRVAPPAIPNPPGTQQSREIVVARFFSDIQLRGVNSILVTAETNQRSVRP
jgi:hypothetical protein